MTHPRFLLLASSLLSIVAAAPIPADPAYPTAAGLFAGVEEAWSASDAERIAAMVDTTTVRIRIKTGAPIATASTRVAVAFLLQDQLRLVHTDAFRLTRFDCDSKRPVCRAWALWSGDWGGRQGKRRVRVALTARPLGSRWLLTEIRTED